MPRRCVIGVDLGGSAVAAGLLTTGGEVLAQAQEGTHTRGPGTAVTTLLDVVQRMRQAAGALDAAVEGIGIGVPGTVDAESGVIGKDIHYVPELAGTSLAATVAAQTGLPVYVDNDVNVLALGEWMFGAGRGARFLVVLAIGTGVGGGIIQDGRLVRGQGGFGGELAAEITGELEQCDYARFAASASGPAEMRAALKRVRDLLEAIERGASDIHIQPTTQGGVVRYRVDGILRNGAERARALSEPIMRQVEDIVGFLRP